MPLDHGRLAPTPQRPTTMATRRSAYSALAGVLILVAAVAGCSDDEPAANEVPSTPTESSESTEAGDTETTGSAEATDDSDPDASASTVAADDAPSQAESTIVPETSPAATAVEQPPVGVETLPPVSLAEPAEVESGLEFTLVALRDVEVEPEEGRGDIRGPAVAIDVEVVNNSDADVELGGFAVSAMASDAELSPIPGTYGERFPASLAPGETASATYGFRTGGAAVTLVRFEDGLSRSIVIVEP